MADEGGRFAAFVTEVEPRLRRALIATYGVQAGREATVDALAYAWEQRDRLAEMTNPVGYLYRVGQTSARRQRRVSPAMSPSPADIEEAPEFEPALRPALASLSEQQRAVVVLIHGYGWSQREAAATLGLSPSTVRNPSRSSDDPPAQSTGGRPSSSPNRSVGHRRLSAAKSSSALALSAQPTSTRSPCSSRCRDSLRGR